MKTLKYNGKTYQFTEDIQPKLEGITEYILTNTYNVRCEVVFENGTLVYINELD
ncbi:hypothetical protein [Veillonella caviae]|uniref:hypothetical protein n=1 Tax=Veillonella caviae TaxID=248316 RepID=UPI0013DEC9EE|nr:hypothetical protein [Veillonella caviae]